MNKTEKLTKYPFGSMRELLTIAFPLMLSILSSSIMTVVDRLFLTRWNIEIIGGIVTAIIVSFCISYTAAGVTSITGVLVGQYNGAKQHGKVAAVMWQMIYFSFMLAFLSVPLAWIFHDIFFVGFEKLYPNYHFLLQIKSF